MIKIQEYDFFIFDCDGVILNSNSIKNFAFRLTLKNENKDLVDSFIKYHKENGGISRYEKFQHFFKNMKKSYNYKKEVSEARKAVHEASLSIASLGASWTEHFEDESATKNHQKWVLKDQEGLQQDLDHIQDQITILENYIDPYFSKEDKE